MSQVGTCTKKDIPAVAGVQETAVHGVQQIAAPASAWKVGQLLQIPGMVKSYGDNRFGFIKTDDTPDLFFTPRGYRHAVERPDGSLQLVGDRECPDIQIGLEVVVHGYAETNRGSSATTWSIPSLYQLRGSAWAVIETTEDEISESPVCNQESRMFVQRTTCRRSDRVIFVGDLNTAQTLVRNASGRRLEECAFNQTY